MIFHFKILLFLNSLIILKPKVPSCIWIHISVFVMHLLNGQANSWTGWIVLAYNHEKQRKKKRLILGYNTWIDRKSSLTYVCWCKKLLAKDGPRYKLYPYILSFFFFCQIGAFHYKIRSIWTLTNTMKSLIAFFYYN